MATISIVDDYIIKAIQRAQFDPVDDGGCTAWVPEFPGLIALGPDGQACLLDLWRRVEDWIQTSVEERLQLPVLDGLDLNIEKNRRLVIHHKPTKPHERGRFFESDEEFLKALGE
jgi:hypothetical protein